MIRLAGYHKFWEAMGIHYEINPEYSLEGLMLKLKLQYFGHLMWTANWLEIRPQRWERLRAKGEGGGRGWDGWMASLTRWTWVWASSGRQWRTGKPGVLQSMRSQRVGHDWAIELQQWAYGGHQYSFEERHFVQGGNVFNKNNYLLCSFVRRWTIWYNFVQWGCNWKSLERVFPPELKGEVS